MSIPISRQLESWCHANAGFDLTLKILKKDEKYRLFFSQPANCTEDVFIELSGQPIRWLKELNQLPHNKYVAIVGNQGYGETDLDAVIEFLGVQFYGRFERSNIS